MLPKITIAQLQDWTGGTLTGPGTTGVGGISTDSRTLKRGEVFLALRGDNFDGHGFLEKAQGAGASAVIAEEDPGLEVPLLRVKDTTQAMMAIASGLRGLFAHPVLALTGSAGKSSTKEMLRSLLGTHAWASPASFNNRVGVSKTLFDLQSTHRCLVLEVGMNAFGEIQEICEFSRPELGLITNIGDAHMGKLGGVDGVYRAKKELFDYLATHGQGVAVNQDDPKVVRAFTEAFTRPPSRVVRYSGRGKTGNDVVVHHAALNGDSGALTVECEVGGHCFSSQVPIFGLHHRENVAASLAGAYLLGVAPKDLAARLGQVRPAPHRGEVHPLPDGRLLIDESYNSNPAALRSALASVFQLRPTRPRLLVLGEMLEMGEFTDQVHREAGEQLASLADGPLYVVGVGKATKALLKAVGNAGGCYHRETVDEALDVARDLSRQAEVVFVKGSRGNRLEKLVEALRK